MKSVTPNHRPKPKPRKREDYLSFKKRSMSTETIDLKFTGDIQLIINK